MLINKTKQYSKYAAVGHTWVDLVEDESLVKLWPVTGLYSAAKSLLLPRQKHQPHLRTTKLTFNSCAYVSSVLNRLPIAPCVAFPLVLVIPILPVLQFQTSAKKKQRNSSTGAWRLSRTTLTCVPLLCNLQSALPAHFQDNKVAKQSVWTRRPTDGSLERPRRR